MAEAGPCPSVFGPSRQSVSSPSEAASAASAATAFADRDPAFRRTASAGEEKSDHRRSSFQDFSRLAPPAAAFDCAFLNVTSGRNVATTRARPNSTRSAMTRSMFL